MDKKERRTSQYGDWSDGCGEVEGEPLDGEGMREEIAKFQKILLNQRNYYSREDEIGFEYSCDLISLSLTTLYIRLGQI